MVPGELPFVAAAATPIPMLTASTATAPVPIPIQRRRARDDGFRDRDILIRGLSSSMLNPRSSDDIRVQANPSVGTWDRLAAPLDAGIPVDLTTRRPVTAPSVVVGRTLRISMVWS
jgi:hypothetical protein